MKLSSTLRSENKKKQARKYIIITQFVLLVSVTALLLVYFLVGTTTNSILWTRTSVEGQYSIVDTGYSEGRRTTTIKAENVQIKDYNTRGATSGETNFNNNLFDNQYPSTVYLLYEIYYSTFKVSKNVAISMNRNEGYLSEDNSSTFLDATSSVYTVQSTFTDIYGKQQAYVEEVVVQNSSKSSNQFSLSLSLFNIPTPYQIRSFGLYSRSSDFYPKLNQWVDITTDVNTADLVANPNRQYIDITPENFQVNNFENMKNVRIEMIATTNPIIEQAISDTEMFRRNIFMSQYILEIDSWLQGTNTGDGVVDDVQYIASTPESLTPAVDTTLVHRRDSEGNLRFDADGNPIRQADGILNYQAFKSYRIIEGGQDSDIDNDGTSDLKNTEFYKDGETFFVINDWNVRVRITFSETTADDTKGMFFGSGVHIKKVEYMRPWVFSLPIESLTISGKYAT